MKKLNLIGSTFSRLKVIEQADNDGYSNTMWLCLCQCGQYVVVKGSKLKNGRTRSCGCIRELNRLTHNMSNSAEYRVWCHMKDRCYNKKDKSYHNYGGRGINVCDRWLQSFENFYEDMGDRPSTKHSLDRYPDMNGDYESSNCRWATKKEQNDNTRRNIKLVYNGEEKVISDWAEELGVNYQSIQYQLKSKTFSEIVEYYRAGNKGKKPSGNNCHFSKTKGMKSAPTKLILNLETGIYYEGCKDAAFSKNYKESALYRQLNGKIKNKSGMMLV